MRILLALIAVFTMAQAQAHCFIADVFHKHQFTADPVTINLDEGHASEVKNLEFMTLQTPHFVCTEGSDGTPNQFNMSVEDNNTMYYEIQSWPHKLYLKVSLTPEPPVTITFAPKSYYDIIELNKFQYKLTYSVQKNFTGVPDQTVPMNTAIKLSGYIKIRPAECITSNCGRDNSTDQYSYYVQIKPVFTPSTCSFKDQEVSVPNISSQELASATFQTVMPDQPKLECNSTTGVATSNIHYRFEPVGVVAGKTLHNELENQPGGAGQVGFQLMNNDEEIDFKRSQIFTVVNSGDTLQNGTTFPLNLKVKYMRYGNRVVAGNVQSKAKVVVLYD